MKTNKNAKTNETLKQDIAKALLEIEQKFKAQKGSLRL